ncbi:putative ABC transporter ATP-binding protein [Dictyobacter alpinus]|uniref:Putative ABC transporter ATP-binding protein n=1 Tax=Dictyobacter alpinus TaxID=2014873 RepID=A0A402BL83_9CHLR|nr:ABC transporter ATP-binding protein [Dictyobacter alpinus]GCE32123.1 putative ABC transporter ATP-binding protein [Dictyobacter alpinus]
MMKDIRLIFRYLFPALRPYVWPILGSLGLTGMVVSIDLLQPYCFKWLVDAATVSLSYQVVILVLLILFGLTIARSLLSYWEVYARSKVGEGISAQYRKRLFEHILHLPFSTLHNLPSGILENRVMTDSGMVGRVYVSTGLLPLIAHLVQAAALVVLIMWLNWQVGMASLLIFPLGWLLTQGMTRRNHARLVQLRSVAEQGHTFLEESYSCLREIRAAGNEAGEMQRWQQWLHTYGQLTTLSTTKNRFVREALNHLIEWIGLCIVYGYGGWQLLQHSMTIGSLLAIALYVQQFYTMLTSILSARIETGEAANAVQAINEILAMPREWPEQGHVLGEVTGALEFDNVAFSYTGSEEHLQHISFASTPGQATGIVGPSGSGKSTLMNLCMRFYEPTRGRILLDGQDIKKIAPHALRQQIGVVSQDIQLWNTTIRENLLYGLRQDVPWEHVLDVCQKTCVHQFVQKLPDGYDTVVGPRGAKLSGGEKQRIALARLLLRDTKILLLDEATSALDSLTEAAITQTLLQIGGMKNRILVAHRLATVQNADRILVIKDGEIVEEGSPQELYQQNGLYTALYHSQRLGTEELSTTAERP